MPNHLQDLDSFATKVASEACEFIEETTIHPTVRGILLGAVNELDTLRHLLAHIEDGKDVKDWVNPSGRETPNG